MAAGKDLVVVVNQESGTATATASPVREALLPAEVVECALDELSGAPAEAAGRGRALEICGGDGTVNPAASVAATRGRPLAVLPGGTLNSSCGFGSAGHPASAARPPGPSQPAGSRCRRDEVRAFASGSQE